MDKVIAAFVGYAPDLEHPFSVSINHGNALRHFADLRKIHRISVKNIPKYYGFVVKADDGSLRYANRCEAYAIAAAADQLKYKPVSYSNTGGSLDSYQIKEYVRDEILQAYEASEQVCKQFADMEVDNILP